MVVHQVADSDSSSCSGASSWSSCSSSETEFDDVNPTHLLSVAIKKRRAAYNRKERDFRQELLHTGLIQSLCKYLGEVRMRRRRHRRSKSSRSRSACRKREWSDNASLASSGSTKAELASFTCHKITILGDNVGVTQPNIQCTERVSPDGSEFLEPPEKKLCRCEDADPFGLEPIFKEMFGSQFSQIRSHSSYKFNSRGKFYSFVASNRTTSCIWILQRIRSRAVAAHS